MPATSEPGGGRTPKATSWPLVLMSILYLAALTTASLHVAASPEWNLDVVFYSALARTPSEPLSEVHSHIYAEIEQRLPQQHVDALLNGSQYRRGLHTSFELFALQLPFYVNKPLYVWLCRAFGAAGVPVLQAPYAASLAAFLLIGALLPVLAIRAGARPPVALGVAACAVWLPQFRELGTLATPDALATALLTAATAALLSSVRVAAPFFVGAVLARPDVVILALALLLAKALRAPGSQPKRDAMAVAALTCATAAATLLISESYGWQVLMRHTFIDRLDSAQELRSAFGVRDYFVAIGRGLRGHMALHPALFVPYLALAVLAWRRYAAAGRPAPLQPAHVLLVAIWAASALRFLVIPLLADRFLAPAYALTLALAAALIAPADPV